MIKVLWLDTETTGLIPGVHGVHQVAGIVEPFGPLVEGSIPLEEFNLTMNPLSHCEVSTWDGGDALSISGSTVDMLDGYQSYDFGHISLINLFREYITPVKEDKFILAGYNTAFDKDMLFGMDKSLEVNEMYKYIDHRVIDVMTIARTVYALGKFPSEPKDFKLSTICAVFDVAIDAHQALSDIQATRRLFFKLLELLK